MSPSPPHVLVFPLPLQGPVNSALKLAELLCLSHPTLHVTFLVTHHIHARLTRHSNLQDRFSSSYGARFRVLTISDGLPEDHPRGDKFMELFDSLKGHTRPLFKEMLSQLMVRDDGTPVTCLLADGILGFASDVAAEVGMPLFSLRTISASCLWVFFCLPELIENGEIPFQGNNLDLLVKSVPGMETYLRRRDLPGFCRSEDINDNPNIQLYKTERELNQRAHGLILNTFEELEAPILNQIRTICQNTYPIGPLHAHLKAKLSSSSQPAFSNSLWEEDNTCITWLDAQPDKSVIYVSFGSLAVLTHDQLLEFWHGLVDSGQRFLWVIRLDSVLGEGQIPDELLSSQATKERGYIVKWAPQERVLAHRAIGGFLTHSGWNSTLESIYEGVPMICWPYFLDQQVNSRLVEESWRLGLDMKDVCNRSVIEKTVRDLLVVRKEEFSVRADQMAKDAKRSLCEGGSSYDSLERLVKDIELISMKNV